MTLHLELAVGRRAVCACLGACEPCVCASAVSLGHQSVAHVSPLSCLFTPPPMRFLNPVEAGLPLPLPAAPLPPDLVLDVCISEVLLENKEAGGWICVRWSQTMPVTARPPLAFRAGLASSLRCLPANWEREGASCALATDGFKGATCGWAA